MPKFISDDQIEQALLQRLQHVCKFDVLEFHLVLVLADGSEIVNVANTAETSAT